jgi:hypothetical protein
LHRGSEYNRGTGCGKTARPGLYGGCRATGIPTVETPKLSKKNLKTIVKTQCRLFSIVFIEPSKAEEINHEPDVDP